MWLTAGGSSGGWAYVTGLLCGELVGLICLLKNDQVVPSNLIRHIIIWADGKELNKLKKFFWAIHLILLFYTQTQKNTDAKWSKQQVKCAALADLNAQKKQNVGSIPLQTGSNSSIFPPFHFSHELLPSPAQGVDGIWGCTPGRVCFLWSRPKYCAFYWFGAVPFYIKIFKRV